MTATQKITANERLAKVEATVEALVRDVSALKQDTRAYFLTLLTVIVTMWASLIVALNWGM